MTLNTNEDFRSKFNVDWTQKLIIGIDEVLLDKKEDSERIKNLSTAKGTKTEGKGKDKVEGNFFGKFIMCSNNETNFVYIDDKEIRYWVRKINSLDKVDPDFTESLMAELPLFISYISKREITTSRKTRMWFTKEELKTEALDRLVYGAKFYFEKELILILSDCFEQYEIDEIKFTAKDILDMFKENGQRVSLGQITRVLKNDWKLNSENSSYPKYHQRHCPIADVWITETENKKGRYYTFEKKFIKSMLKS